MTKEQRQALREKHSNKFTDEFDKDICAECGWMTPCDAIKVLNWADEVLEELKSLTAHFEGIWY